jgi:hypothetical protein
MAVALLALAAVALGAGAARAELFRCGHRDGSVTFTDNPSLCPSARPHELRGAVQSVPSSAPSRRRGPASPSSGRGGATLEQRAAQGEEARWRERKQRGEEELQRLEERSQHLRGYVTHCNRGGELFARDRDSGLKHGVSCDSVRAEYAALESQAASLRDYLARGIFEECRRSGCLPGWLR